MWEGGEGGGGVDGRASTLGIVLINLTDNTGHVTFSPAGAVGGCAFSFFTAKCTKSQPQ